MLVVPMQRKAQAPNEGKEYGRTDVERYGQRREDYRISMP